MKDLSTGKTLIELVKDGGWGISFNNFNVYQALERFLWENGIKNGCLIPYNKAYGYYKNGLDNNCNFSGVVVCEKDEDMYFIQVITRDKAKQDNISVYDDFHKDYIYGNLLKEWTLENHIKFAIDWYGLRKETPTEFLEQVLSLYTEYPFAGNNAENNKKEINRLLKLTNLNSETGLIAFKISKAIYTNLDLLVDEIN